MGGRGFRKYSVERGKRAMRQEARERLLQGGTARGGLQEIQRGAWKKTAMGQETREISSSCAISENSSELMGRNTMQVRAFCADVNY